MGDTSGTARTAAAAARSALWKSKTITTGLLPGYLRKNGVPFSEKTTLTEHWDLLRQPTGEQWIAITTVVDDPTYLTRTWITSLNFKKEANGSWDPSGCEAT